MKKNNKTDKEYTDKLDPTEEELLVDDIDILDIDDDDIGIDTNFIDVDLNKDDEETDFVTENEEKDHRDTIQADINVVVCPNCKEAVLESDLCSICGKPLKKINVGNSDDIDEDDLLQDTDLFNINDENYLKDEIESSMDNDLIDIQ
ncbi:hypothetical protein M1145_02090 [Patescibacteria group bacterium]|nr:hypothetical protein [Patescibacteria group bacterium]